MPNLCPMPKRPLFIISIVALLHAAGYIVHQRPDWDISWTDQSGYKQLGTALATSGKFTRAPASASYVPESIRTPGYPAFLALIYLAFGVNNQMAVAIVQAFVFVLICLGAFALGRRLGGERVGIWAGALCAAFSPLPYFAALAMTELWTTFLLTMTVIATFRARETERDAWAVAAGVLAGLTALTRPVFVLLPFALFGSVIVLDRLRGVRRWMLATLIAVITLVPWFTYNYIHFQRFTMSPANGFGRAVWEASWQGRWSGRLQNELTQLADQTRQDRAALDARVHELATLHHEDAAPMLDYVHQWQDIRVLWFDVADPYERMMARMRADDAYMQQGIRNAMADPVAHLRRRLTRGLFVLWAAEIPYRYSEINDLPVWVIRAMWLAQAVLVALALVGILLGVRQPTWRETVLVAVVPGYVTAVHWLLLTEARQSLPATPALLVLSAWGIWLLTRRKSHAAA
jgi:4-amino-4-deoxy-L-arabinose transferase-like glycosyltransferase